MRTNKYLFPLGLSLSLFFAFATACFAADQADPDPEYTRVINERARKIVDKLEIEEAEIAEHVQSLIADQYRGLSTIHDTRDANLDALKKLADEMEVDLTSTIDDIRQKAEIEVFKLHRAFVASLAVHLTPEQVEGVKDGLTYGVVPITFAQYLKMLPELAEEEKKQIKAWLIEAREYAMDGGSSEEKHGWFRKFKGRIANYLSARGYDLKAAEAKK